MSGCCYECVLGVRPASCSLIRVSLGTRLETEGAVSRAPVISSLGNKEVKITLKQVSLPWLSVV